VTWGETLARLRPETVIRAASAWNTAPLERVSISANVVYRLESGDYLRLVHSALRDEAFLATGLDWSRHLDSSGARVCSALESKHANLIERVDEDWLATVWTGIVGQPLSDRMTEVQLEAWGEAAGRLHAASAQYVPRAVRTSSGEVMPERYSLSRFWANIEKTVIRDAELLVAYRALTAFLESLPPEDALICHGDFRPANALWDGSSVWVVDFDEPAMGWAEYDVARAMSRDTDGPFPDVYSHLETFRHGYERGRGTRLNLERLQGFVPLQALLSLAWSLEDATWGWSHDLRRLALEPFVL
jgi:Ser/Thr protein kinase RdoA (MazF antagonist)